ncbi:hypothetical protein NBRC116598_36170 [Pseudophaeobacter arcticus]|uniref:Uncharacterized protein n=1 Tax=Pseudophaeobacter arcticus TaxID=385492 RepID=A0ABQ0AQM1_9RHOB
MVADNPKVKDFSALDRYLSAASWQGADGLVAPVCCPPIGLEPEHCPPSRKWQIILTAAFERGLQADNTGA